MMNMTPAYGAITLVDLDDTLFQTRRKCPEGLLETDLTPMSFGVDGEPISYATHRQMSMINWLQTSTLFIAVTARSTGALLRTNINFKQAVSAHGGAIINYLPQKDAEMSDARCLRWHKKMRETLLPHQDMLFDLKSDILTHADDNDFKVRANIVTENNLPLYLVIKHQEKDGNDAELLAATLEKRLSLPSDWTCHVNGNNVAFLPPGLGKEHAVSEMLGGLKRQYPHLPVIGIGDSFTDAPFMKLCDMAMTPKGSQLASRLFQTGSNT